MAKTTTKLLAALALVTLGVSACSSGKNSGSGATTPAGGGSSSSSSAPQPTGTPIKIGLLYAGSGSEQTMMKSVPDVAAAWVSMVNDAGGLGGHPVDVIAKDTKGDAATYASSAKDLVENQGVVAVVTSDDVAAPSSAKYFTDKAIPVIGGNDFDTTAWGVRPNYYGNTTNIPYTLLGQASVAKQVGRKKFGTIVCAEVAACLQAQGLFKPAAEKLGMQWTGIVTAAGSSPNYTAQCLSLIQKGTDFISLAVQSSIGVRVIADCLQQNFTGTIGINSNAFIGSEDAKLKGVDIAGNLNGFPWWANAPAAQKFRDAMKKYKPSADYRTSNDTTVWSALELFHKAMATPTGDVTAQSVTAAYGKVQNETLDGLLAQPVTFTAGKPAPLVKCFWMYTFKAGDDNPKLLTAGTSGNGANGDLQSTCAEL
jgi:branched-chain amino acid transport system substrate-binding protein